MALEIRKPRIKQIGKVITEVRSISVIIFLFTPLFLANEQPTKETLFTFPELIGIPKAEQMKRVTKDPKSEKKARGVSHFSIDFDSDPIIFLPPRSVENAITRETASTRKIGGLFALIPTKSRITPMNFCPSWTPCINESEAEERSKSFLKGKFLLHSKRVAPYETKNDKTQENTIKITIFKKCRMKP